MIHYTKYDFSQLARAPKCYDQRSKKYIVNAAFAFDIETTTIDTDAGKRSFMYIWQFGIMGIAVYGRTWDEYADFLNRFRDALHLDERKAAIIYVHNLGFEFEFLYSHFKMCDVFARSSHHPIYARDPEHCIEYRDSLILSGLNLAKTAENLTWHNIRKMVGDLDYSKIRHSGTELTAEELKYCENDVLILNAYIDEEIRYCKRKLSRVPLTRTGYARKRFRNALQKSEMWDEWHHRIKRSYPTPEQFCLLNKCFSGGFVHGNAMHVGLICSDVTSVDFASSYPAQMVRHKYPLGKWRKVDISKLTRSRFEKMMENCACMCEIMFKDIKSTGDHSIISRSKCLGIANGVFDNGRVVSADRCRTYITDVDYRTLKLFYTWDKIHVYEMYTTNYSYLPRPFVQEVLNLYAIKTELKGIHGKEDEYQRGKGDLNAGYGMSVTNPVDDDIIFDPETGEWSAQRGDLAELLNKNKNSRGYFLPYCVGVWITSFARFELLSVVAAIGRDVLYCDTDSIKMQHYKEHEHIIQEYNERCINEINAALEAQSLDPEQARPKTKTGKMKQLGVFEIDAEYQFFKTLGAKRYCYIKDGEFGFTASGIPKGKPLQYIKQLAEQTGEDPLDLFREGLCSIPAEMSEKLTHYAFNDRFNVPVTDYQGNTRSVEISSCCVLVPQPYEMNTNKQFLSFLMRVQKTPLIGKAQPLIGDIRPELKIRAYD